MTMIDPNVPVLDQATKAEVAQALATLDLGLVEIQKNAYHDAHGKFTFASDAYWIKTPYGAEVGGELAGKGTYIPGPKNPAVGGYLPPGSAAEGDVVTYKTKMTVNGKSKTVMATGTVTGGDASFLYVKGTNGQVNPVPHGKNGMVVGVHKAPFLGKVQTGTAETSMPKATAKKAATAKKVTPGATLADGSGVVFGQSKSPGAIAKGDHVQGVSGKTGKPIKGTAVGPPTAMGNMAIQVKNADGSISTHPMHVSKVKSAHAVAEVKPAPKKTAAAPPKTEPKAANSWDAKPADFSPDPFTSNAHGVDTSVIKVGDVVTGKNMAGQHVGDVIEAGHLGGGVKIKNPTGQMALGDHQITGHLSADGKIKQGTAKASANPNANKHGVDTTKIKHGDEVTGPDLDTGAHVKGKVVNVSEGTKNGIVEVETGGANHAIGKSNVTSHAPAAAPPAAPKVVPATAASAPAPKGGDIHSDALKVKAEVGDTVIGTTLKGTTVTGKVTESGKGVWVEDAKGVKHKVAQGKAAPVKSGDTVIVEDGYGKKHAISVISTGADKAAGPDALGQHQVGKVVAHGGKASLPELLHEASGGKMGTLKEPAKAPAAKKTAAKKTAAAPDAKPGAGAVGKPGIDPDAPPGKPGKGAIVVGKDEWGNSGVISGKVDHVSPSKKNGVHVQTDAAGGTKYSNYGYTKEVEVGHHIDMKSHQTGGAEQSVKVTGIDYKTGLVTGVDHNGNTHTAWAHELTASHGTSTPSYPKGAPMMQKGAKVQGKNYDGTVVHGHVDSVTAKHTVLIDDRTGAVHLVPHGSTQVVGGKAVNGYVKPFKAKPTDGPAGKGIDLGDGGKAVQYAQHMESNWLPKVTSTEKTAIAHYTGSSYTAISGALRTGSTSGTSYNHAMKVKSAIAKNKLEEPLVLYRGVSNWTLSNHLYHGESGNPVLIDLGFSSTAITKGGAFNKSSGGGGRKIRIVAPAGTEGAYLDSISTCKGELELLLQAGTALEIVKDDGEYLHARVIKQGITYKDIQGMAKSHLSKVQKMLANGAKPTAVEPAKAPKTAAERIKRNLEQVESLGLTGEARESALAYLQSTEVDPNGAGQVMIVGGLVYMGGDLIGTLAGFGREAIMGSDMGYEPSLESPLQKVGKAMAQGFQHSEVAAAKTISFDQITWNTASTSATYMVSNIF